jgi:hypothetical protein
VNEIARTAAWRVPRGAELVGGNCDGLVVISALAEMFSADGRGPFVVFLLSDGSEVPVPSKQEIAWLHPEARRQQPR